MMRIDKYDYYYLKNGYVKTKVELKQCPLCTGKGHLIEAYHMWYVQCDKCFMQTAMYKGRKNAIRRWNNRDYETHNYPFDYP